MSGGSTPWREIVAPDDVAEAICHLYRERGSALYDEEVSQSTHAVQSARLAAAAGADAPLQAAALLHDIAHLLERDPREGSGHPDRDLRHEEVAARFLANWFGPDVTEPIRHHVAAKRWLVATEPGYAAGLSAASIHSLGLQGGPMSADEAREFAARPGAAAAVRLRRWDDLAKDPASPARDIDEFAGLLARLCREQPGR